MDTITVYSASELKKKFPNGFEHALNQWENDHTSNVFWTDEIMDSMKAVFKKVGLTLKDWSISGGSSCYVKFSIPTYWSELADTDLLVDDYTGKKAERWLKESLLDGASFKRVNYEVDGEKGFRYDLFGNGESVSCPLTGVCFDHDFIDSLPDDVKSGCTLFEAFDNLADCAGKLFYNEWKNQISEEYFIDLADANDWQFTENGRMV